MLFRTLLALMKSPRHPRVRHGAMSARPGSRRKPRPIRGPERLEDRLVPDSCFSELLRTEHADLAFNYFDGDWNVTVGNASAFPPAHTAPAQTLLFVGPQAQTTQPGGAEWEFIGAGAGNPFWRLPSSQDPSLLLLGTAAQLTPFGTFASYFESDPRISSTFPWIRATLMDVRGPGQFSVWQTGIFGGVTVWMSTADGIDSTDAFYVPEQGHFDFNWGFTQPGFYEVDIQASAFLNDGSMTPVASPVTTFYFSVDPVLQATSLRPNATGFQARFNRPIDLTVLNPDDGKLGPADVTLTGPSGNVSGSLVFDGLNCVTFVQSGGASLAPGIYTVRLRSGDDAFKTTDLDTQSVLDGNGDGIPGDDFLFTFEVPGTALVIDDGDAGFLATPGFFSFSGQGFQGDVTFAAPGDGSESAVWTFSGLPPGLYRVSATWSADPNRAADAVFYLYDGDVLAGSAGINQQQAPDDFADQDAFWEDLGGALAVSSGVLRVYLPNAASGFVIADAIRIERVGDLTPPSAQVIDDGDPGFFASPGFFPFAGEGFQGDVTFAAPGDGSEFAYWYFSDLAPGVYRVSATWSADPNRASDATFYLLDGESFAGAAVINQQQAPDDFSDQDASWEDLGTFTVSSGALLVYLPAVGNGYLIADAVRIERIG